MTYSRSRYAGRLLCLLLVLVLSLSVLAPPASAAAARRYVGGWIPYWSTTEAVASFKANADLFADVSPFWHSLTSDTVISDQETATDRSVVLSAARAAGVRVVPAVTDGTGKGNLAAAIADPSRRSTIVQTFLNLVASRGYDGIDLDLEGFAYTDGKATWATTRPNWVAFVAELGARLHERGKVLFATIPPTYDSTRSASSGYWVYDYAGIAPHVDRVRIMAYDYSVGSPGPIAPYNWVQRIAKYAVTQVPSGKVILGIPTYGRDWVTSVRGACPAGTKVERQSLTASRAWQLASQQRVAVQWDATARERTFTYTQTAADPRTSCTITRRVYFSDASAVTERSRLVDSYLLGGVAFWSIGGEDANQWGLLRILASNPWDPRVAPLEQLQGFVKQAYRDVLGREADAAGLNWWTGQLRSGALDRSGLMRRLVVSHEGATRAATDMYSEILGRASDPAGLAIWVARISGQAVGLKDARARFWASPERQARSGSVGQWVNDLYRTELGRPADPAGLAHWSQVARAQGFLAAASGVLGSREWSEGQVTGLYRSMLGRSPDPAGLSHWVGQLMRSDLSNITIRIGASAEYFAHANK